MKTHRFSAICLTGFLVALVVAIVLILLGGPPTHASPGVLYVAPGANCGGMIPCHSTVQAAVDAALSSDEIRVAAGVYIGVNNHGGLAQVVYISKSVTIQGGYTTAFTEPPDPVRNPTTLDAQGWGRVIVISGTATSTIEGLRITGGDASGLGGAGGHDAGGGVYVLGAAATISDCMVYGNKASTVE